MGSNSKHSDVEAEIEKLIEAQASTDELLTILGEEDGALFASPSDKKIRGLRFLRNAIERIQGQICANGFLRAHGENPSMQRKALAVAAILDFLGSKGAATASVLIVQIGLENVCARRWEQHVR